ncbi:MAG: nitroreductase family protein [Oscillospiraceae bacterium]|nr:nitroreductase family protein [Oscillospiraceae bacterium]
MDIMREIESRRSVRKFQTRSVSEEAVRQIIEAGRLAPSGNNSQPWRFLIVRDEETKKRIVAADSNQQWMLDAPVFIVCMGDIRSRMAENVLKSVDEDTGLPDMRRIVRDMGIAVGYMLLEIEHMGLSTCWTGAYDQKAMREAAGVPEYMYISGVLPIGYGAEAPKARPRKDYDDIVRFERWE